MEPMANRRPQPKPLVRFRTNGGGVFVHDGIGWLRATPELMTDVATVLFNMVRFNPKA
jgi:hypothetical protein